MCEWWQALALIWLGFCLGRYKYGTEFIVFAVSVGVIGSLLGYVLGFWD